MSTSKQKNDEMSEERVDLARYIPLLEKMKANAEARNGKKAKQKVASGS